MTGNEMYRFLSGRGVGRLHHANSVKTSISQLGFPGLASRQLVERQRLPQTNQFTDDLDREFGVWNDIFVDTVDIHWRMSDRNKYGPVLFVLDVGILNFLPPDAQVFVTRSNPSKWIRGQSDAMRFFLTVEDLHQGFEAGNFDQMLVIRTRGGLVSFGQALEEIVLDEPLNVNGDSPVFNEARAALLSAALGSGINVPVVKRNCRVGCRCVTSYSVKNSRIPWFFNSP